MKVDFYTSNEQLAPTVGNYLFSQECSLIMNGQYIEQHGQWYQVTGQTIADNKTEALAVFVYPVPRRPIRIGV
ncbi:MAG TPA: hypothetical protein DCR40_10125 [Prolixibacteraceae bacterium]|uniref:Uncharacterized protein n=1 Tax=candidate division WS6 bacterium GW2011_GWF1_36_8 TaxID=1619098 RepID=A0A0G0IH33_9BACT|nr:MAG: hypothetical protein US29_C0045G0008 [candidate division WS6 bacterium GW2011_GWF1_36_8]KKQ19337.1 MAG: hypothetical protein US34_C0023G0011 [Candidatus Nomurabacteria bacterium GW2011_GWC2_36_9]HAQ19571.1 hypothetical protein [Prolixibacteraceae bacterium]